MNASRAPASALVVLVCSVLAACGDAGSSPSGSVTPPLISARLTPNSTKTAPAQPKPSESAPAPAASPSMPAELSKDGCPETEKGKRACSAAAFQKAWRASPSPQTFPSSAKYKVTGKVTKLEPSDKAQGQTGDLRVYMAGDTKNVGFIFRFASRDIAAASQLAVGAEASFQCEFGGLEEIGVVTLSECTL